MVVFWNVALRSLVETDWLCGAVNCLHQHWYLYTFHMKTSTLTVAHEVCMFSWVTRTQGPIYCSSSPNPSRQESVIHMKSYLCRRRHHKHVTKIVRWHKALRQSSGRDRTTVMRHCKITESTQHLWNFVSLRPSGNYMNHLLWQSVMLHFLFIRFAWFSL
jgi:hypothetical protein